MRSVILESDFIALTVFYALAHLYHLLINTALKNRTATINKK